MKINLKNHNQNIQSNLTENISYMIKSVLPIICVFQVTSYFQFIKFQWFSYDLAINIYQIYSFESLRRSFHDEKIDRKKYYS